MDDESQEQACPADLDAFNLGRLCFLPASGLLCGLSAFHHSPNIYLTVFAVRLVETERHLLLSHKVLGTQRARNIASIATPSTPPPPLVVSCEPKFMSSEHLPGALR